MPTPFATSASRPQFVMPEDFLRLTEDASLRKNADGDVLLECDWQTYHSWEYLSASHPAWPAGTVAKVFVAECMYQKYGYDRSKWDELALAFLRRAKTTDS